MSKKDWKKQLLRMKQLADQNLGRSEKSEVLTDDLQLLERQINQIKDAWQTIVKKLQACLIPYNGEAEKRLRKLPEYAFSSCLGDLAVTFNNETVFGKMFGLCSEAQMCVAKGLVHYTMDVEAKVIHPAQVLLDRDIPAILKLRRQLANMTLDMDSAKTRYQALCKQTQNAASSVRLEASREEFEEAEAKVEHCKDVFATEMYSFFAREEELCKMLLSLLESQSAYHRHSVDALDQLIPLVREEIDLMATRPVFGCSLEEHLRHSKREIASVIEECVVTIIRKGLDVEGIFRIAPAASKVKKLKAAFDANMAEMDEFDDIHCFCAAMKHYLRELPEPIMTFELYNEWLQACQRPPDERLNALWVVVDKLPKFNYINLRYLIKFLAKVAEHSDVNKMNASNLGIVIGPNLLWPPGENRSDIQHTSALTLIVETLIGSSEWFFPGDIDFPSSGIFASNASISSSTDMTSQKSQAKLAFLANSQNDNTVATLTTSSSAGSLLEHSAVSESKLTEGVSSNVFKLPKKVKKTAPAPPVPTGNHHQRSASVSVLASNVSSMMQETTSVGASKQDDVLDRKTATLTRPRFPPPARPSGPDKTNAPLQPACPDVSRNPVTKNEQTDDTLSHKESSESFDRIAGSNTLEIPKNLSKKLVTRSLDDVVSESTHGEKYRSVSRSPCFEGETVSDTEEVFSHHQKPVTSSDSALNLASGNSGSKVESQIGDKFGLNERTAAECLEDSLSGYEPSKPVDSAAEIDNGESIAMQASVASVDSDHSKGRNASSLPLGASWAIGQGVQVHRQDFVDSNFGEPRLEAVKEVSVSVEPPTPEASSCRNQELHVEPEPPFIDEGDECDDATVLLKKRSETERNTVIEGPLKETNKSYPEISHCSSSTVGHDSSFAGDGNLLETNSSVKTVSHSTGVTLNRSQHNAEVTSRKDASELGVVADRGNVQFEGRSKSSVGDYEAMSKPESEISRTKRPEVSIMPYKDRHQVNEGTEQNVTEVVPSDKISCTIEASGERERCNVRIMAYKDRDRIMNTKSDGSNTTGIDVQSESNLGKQDDLYKNLNKPDECISSAVNVQQGCHKTNSARFSSTSFATDASVGSLSAADYNVTNSNASSSNRACYGAAGSSSADYGPAGIGVSSQVKPSDHSEMVQSLKLFFLSDKSPPTATRGRSNSDVDRFRPVTGSVSSQQSAESTKDESSVIRGSTSSLAFGSQSNASQSSSSQASAARFSSSTDVSDRAYSNASQREKFFAPVNPSVPAFHSSFVPEIRGTEGAAKLARPGVPPPPPVRRNRPGDAGSASAVARRSIEDSSKIVEDTRL